MDESDFYNSNEKSQIAKILNNGNAKGFPVLRCEKVGTLAFTTRSFSVYGPKILACRGPFDDPALESRFLSENAGVRPLRATVPLHLDDGQVKEAQKLRNMLLSFRFDHFFRKNLSSSDDLCGLSPRMQQVVSPLLRYASTVDRKRMISWARRQEQQQLRDRGMELAAHILYVLLDTFPAKPSIEIGQIRTLVMERFGDHYEHPLSAKAIGMVVRNALHLETKRIKGRYVVERSQSEKIKLLAKRYGVDNVL